ncbi:hypothetical protein T440DRAFT_195374 [Plenodomus tracheiphilus IPT5]|uniref:Uncharacterized protein n=1 Tax=Plenodomus tracheiphilus IPT5 TaxID=1408161 RepID=A0A6A7AX34_9PLEO|nr:hypothetical protein T440DRAFT_195374 [Plenodomus tracheiphilus IPT5]
MTSYPPSRNEEAKKAAKKYIHRYHKHAVKYLVDHCDPVELLKNACSFEEHDYHKIMSEDFEEEDDTASHSSHVSQVSHGRTFSSHSRSEFPSSSTVPSSRGSGGSTSKRTLWVMPDTVPKSAKTLEAAILPGSDYLIQIKVVRSRLMLEPTRHSGRTMVHYNGWPIDSLGTISLEWRWDSTQLTSKEPQQNTFHVVEMLPDCEAIVGNSDPPHSPIRGKAKNHDARYNLYDRAPMDETLSVNTGELHLREADRTHSVTANSTARTERQTVVDRSSRGQQARRQSTASGDSKIPVRMSSGSSIGSISNVPSRPSAAQRAHDGPLHPPPPSQGGVTSGVSVTLLCAGQMMTLKLELDASGAIFYESLQRTILKKAKHELDRFTESVRLTPQKNCFDDCCHISLEEDEIKDSWEMAVEWIQEHRAKEPCKIYAHIGPD